RSKTTCPEPWCMVRADDLEQAVLADLFELFGNPAAVMRAMAEAAPDQGEREDCLRRQGEALGRLAEVGEKKQRVVRSIANDVLSEDEASKEMAALRQREDALKRELDALEARLANQPDPEEAHRLAEEVCRRKAAANHDLAAMTWQEKRALVQLVFAGRSDGRG